MDAAVRHLRDGALPDAASCATCCVLDHLGVLGGAMMLKHALQSFISAMRQGRSQAMCVRIVDLNGSLADVAQLTAAPAPAGKPAADVEVVDMYSDPWGWRQDMEQSSAETTSASPLAASPTTSSPQPGLEALKAALLKPPPASLLSQTRQNTAPDATSSGYRDADGEDDVGCRGASASSLPGGVGSAAPGCRSVCVVVGCLSSLMERYGEWQCLSLLEAVQRSPLVSCVLTSLHTDMHPERVVAGLRRQCSCWLEPSPLSPLQTEVAQRALAAGSSGGGEGACGALAGRLDCRVKRRTGRVKVDSELYSLLLPVGPWAHPQPPACRPPPPCRLAFSPAPPFLLDLPDPKALVQLQQRPPHHTAAAAAAPAAAAAAPAAAAPAGGAQQAPVPAVGAVGAAGRAAGGSNGGGGGGGQAVGLLGGVASAGELARAVGSGMRLTLTEEERRAKEQVVLPYQHQGRQRGPAAEAYAAGDHRAYLPPAAGGVGPAAGGPGQRALGHILYVRDSGSEADSDQELDEDLD
ncbi:hypothetical protein Agub_g15513, partial [Astrephomene gubernaculifera]